MYIQAKINVPTIVIGCTFTNNRLLLGHGGAIYVIDSVNLTTVNSTFSSNSAALNSGRGGALYITSTFTDAHFLIMKPLTMVEKRYMLMVNCIRSMA